MISRWKWREQQSARPLSPRAIVLWAVFVLGVAVTSAAVLWWLYRGAEPRVQLDAIRTASAITVAAGGAVALLLAARRQRSTEETLEHQRQTLEHQREVALATERHQRDVAQATERDTSEQRITELYTRAVDQLGAEKAPVRLGGLHALERLAQNNPPQRQTIVDVICAYLRMPYNPPDDQAPGEDAPKDAHTRYEERRQEIQVRLTAQRILSAHLKPKAAEVFWANIDLDLTEAHLHQLDLGACRVRSVQFRRAEFAGDAGFDEAEFAGNAWFTGAKFAGNARFDGAEFAGNTWFDGAKFAAGDAWFAWAEFAGYAGFGGAEFAGNTWFDGAEFAWYPVFDGTRVAPDSGRVVLPVGWINRAALPAEGEDEGWLYVVRDEDASEQLTEAPGGGPV